MNPFFGSGGVVVDSSQTEPFSEARDEVDASAHNNPSNLPRWVFIFEYIALLHFESVPFRVCGQGELNRKFFEPWWQGEARSKKLNWEREKIRMLSYNFTSFCGVLLPFPWWFNNCGGSLFTAFLRSPGTFPVFQFSNTLTHHDIMYFYSLKEVTWLSTVCSPLLKGVAIPDC